MILSWKVFIPLGRMTYIVHLINFNFIKVYFSYTRMPIYSHLAEHIMRHFATLTSVFVISAILALLVEIPFINLDNTFFPVTKKAQSKPITLILHNIT